MKELHDLFPDDGIHITDMYLPSAKWVEISWSDYSSTNLNNRLTPLKGQVDKLIFNLASLEGQTNKVQVIEDIEGICAELKMRNAYHGITAEALGKYKGTFVEEKIREDLDSATRYLKIHVL